jgi:hypothetical protein
VGSGRLPERLGLHSAYLLDAGDQPVEAPANLPVVRVAVLVEVDERPPCGVGDRRAKGRLACTGRADQDEADG